MVGSYHDQVIGTLLVASWFHTALYLAEILQAYSYLKTFRHDGRTTRLLVIVCCIVDTVALVGHYGGVYLYGVTNWGNGEYLLMEHWSVWVYPITTSVTAFLVQMFFIYRCYLLIPDKTNGRILTLLVFLTVVVALLSAISATVIGHAHQEYSQRSAATVPSLIWIVSTACADILIAVTLVWHLRAMQIGLTSHETRNAVFRLTRTAIQTGSITAFLAAVVIVLFLSDKGSNAHVGVGYCLGRCYTLSLLMNLNGRPMLRDCDTVDLGQSELGTTTTTITGEGTRRRSRSRSLMLESPRVEVGTVGMGIDTSARAKAPQDQV